MTDQALAERRRLFESRLVAVRELLARSGAGGILLEARRDFAWLTVGGLNHVLLATDTGAAPLLVTAHRALVLAPVNEGERIAAEETAGLPVEVEALPWWDAQAGEQLARRLAGGRLLLPSDVTSELESLRSLLTPLEHDRLTSLGGAVRAVADTTLGEATRGASEHEVAAELIGRLARQGIRTPVLLAAADERIARFRHPLPTPTAIRDRLMVVIVAERWGLHVAHTQFVELVGRPPEIARRAVGLAAVLGAMRAATIVGNTLGDVLAAARTEYDRQGMVDEWALHHQGGTIGYQARERIAKLDDRTPIRPGMALAWNPSAVGFKLEETLYLDAGGRPHVVTTTPG